MRGLPLPLAIPGYELREFHGTDIPRMCALADDEEVWRSLTDLFPRPYDVEAALHWVTRQADIDPPQNLVIAGPDGLVGGVGVLLSEVPNFAHDGELGYWLGRSYWGRGLTSAAVRAFVEWAGPPHGLLRFSARIFAGNTASIRVVEACGFTHEGVLRQAVRKEGKLLDMDLYGLVL